MLFSFEKWDSNIWLSSNDVLKLANAEKQFQFKAFHECALHEHQKFQVFPIIIVLNLIGPVALNLTAVHRSFYN